MKNFYKLLPLLVIGMILCFPLVSNAQTKKPTSTKSASTSPKDIWEAYPINTQDILSTKRKGVALIKFPITPNQVSNSSNNISYEVNNYNNSDLRIEANYFATYQPVVDEGRMVYDLLPENFGKITINTSKSQNPQTRINLISYKNLPSGMDETKFTFVNSDEKVVYVRMRSVMRNRTLFQMLCKRVESLDDVLCDKFFKSFSFSYK